jgi:hypothetical protein
MGNIFAFAPIVTRVLPTDTNAVDVFGGAIIRVWGFTVSNLTGSSVVGTVRTNEVSPTTIWSGGIAANQTHVVYLPFIADKGLEVVSATGSALSFSIWHSQVGS